EEACDESENIWRRLFHLEEQHALKTTDEPDQGLIRPMYGGPRASRCPNRCAAAISPPVTSSAGPSRASTCSARSRRSPNRMRPCGSAARPTPSAAESSPTPELRAAVAPPSSAPDLLDDVLDVRAEGVLRGQIGPRR